MKPCPFCGGEPYVYKLSKYYVDTEQEHEVWKVVCGARRDCCMLANDFDSEAEAIAAWNSRAKDE